MPPYLNNVPGRADLPEAAIETALGGQHFTVWPAKCSPHLQPKMKGEARLLKSVRLLVVEDMASDVRLLREGLRGSLLRLNITVATDGVEATKVLNEMKISHSLPDVIVLDLNLPRKSGREVLGELKADPLLKHIPVLVLTSSHDEDDISSAYELNANCYIRKPMNLPDYERVMRSIEDFWFMTATLPQHNSLASVATAGGGAIAGNGKVQAQEPRRARRVD